MDERYVVISTRRPAGRGAKGSGKKPGLIPAGASSEGNITSAPSTAPRMVVDIVDRAAAAERKREPGFEAGAPSMPMSLITPFASAAPAAGPIMWGVRTVLADTSPFDGSNVTVAVLDTGIDRTHSAFAGVDIQERDFTGDGNGDQNGHGTHCAGTIFGRDVNGMRIGIARGVTRALIGKVLGRAGGASEHIVSALQWAIDEGANIISMSLGIDFPGYQLRLQGRGLRSEAATSLALEGYRLNVQLFDRIASVIETLAAFRQPCLLIAATGNESGRGDTPPFEIAASPPAVSTGFIAVGALQQGVAGLEVAPFSNSGCDICGPGVDIVSARAGGGLLALSGTSMATPHVAGVAALWAQKLASAGPLAVKPLTTQLLSSGKKTELADGFPDDAVGAGMVTAPQ